MIKTGDGIGDIYVDSIELQDTENALTELPKGRFVVGSLEGLTDDNKLSPVEKTYIKTLITEIDAEYTGVLADGTAAGVSSTFLTALKPSGAHCMQLLTRCWWIWVLQVTLRPRLMLLLPNTTLQ